MKITWKNIEGVDWTARGQSRVYRMAPWAIVWWLVMGQVRVAQWRPLKGLHPDKECPRCRTQRHFLCYYIGPWVISLSVRSIVGAVLREVHAWGRAKTIWCKYDYSA